MWSRLSIRNGLSLLLAIAAGVWLSVGVSTAEDNAKPADPTAQDILNIRERLGLRLFEGTVFGRKARDKDIANEPVDAADEATVFSNKIEKLARTPSTDRATAPQPIDHDPLTWDQGRRPSVRMFARQLEALAADFEDQEFFDEADRLRSMARSMRLRVRGQASHVPSELPAPPANEESTTKSELR
jgi:hypothetical protein